MNPYLTGELNKIRQREMVAAAARRTLLDGAGARQRLHLRLRLRLRAARARPAPAPVPAPRPALLSLPPVAAAPAGYGGCGEPPAA